MSQEPPRAWGGRGNPRLSPTIAWLGVVSLLTAMSSAMVYGLLPVFLVKVLAPAPSWSARSKAPLKRQPR